MGFEMAPPVGEVFFYDHGPIALAFVIGAGLGAVSTRYAISSSAGDRHLDTGWRFAAQLGGGLRLSLFRWVTFRLELRGLFHSSQIERVNGCSDSALRIVDTALRAGVFTRSEDIDPGCHIEANDAPIAYALTRNPQGLLLQHVQLHAGFGLAF